MESAIIQEFKNIDVGIDTKPSYAVLLDESASAKKIARIQGQTNTAGYACIGMAESYRRLGKICNASAQHRDALEHFIETKNNSGLAWAYWNGANISRQKGDYLESIKKLRKSIYFSKISSELDCEHYAVAGLAECTRILGDYKISYLQHLYAYNLFLSIRDYRGVVWAYEGIAQILKNSGQIDKAMRLFAEAITISYKIADFRGLGYAFKCFGECCALRGKLAESLFYLQRGELVFRDIHHKIGLAYTLKATADVFRDYFQYDEAQAKYDEAEKLFAEIEDNRGLAYVDASKGILSLKNANYEAASICFTRSMRIFEQMNVVYGKYVIFGAVREEKRHGKELRRSLLTDKLQNADPDAAH